MSQIKTTCTNLTTLLHKIRERKEATDGPVEEDLIADAMLLFAQLSGQHSRLMREAEKEFDKIHELRDKCDEKQEVLEEQLSYMAYMDTEYDVRPWKPTDGVVEVAESDGHKTIKTKLDTELIGRRKMCEYANTLEDEVSTLRKSEQEMRSELERVRKIMSSISTPPFLEGVTACQNIPDTSLSGPLYTLHQMLSATVREFPDVTVTVTQEDPLLNKNTHYNEQQSLPDDTRSLVAPDPQLLVLNVRNKNTVVFRHHPNINVVSCDDTFNSDVLGRFCERDDGLKEPHTSLSFTFTNPTFTDLISNKNIGRVFCWVHEMCGITVLTQSQRAPVNVTSVQFIQHMLKE